MAVEIGRLLREARWRCELSQRALARRAGVTQATLSRWETGAIVPGFADADRVLAECGLQLEARLVQRHDDLHAEFARLAALGPFDRLGRQWFWTRLVLAELAALQDEVVVTGSMAALLQGVPVERLSAELLLPDDDEVLARYQRAAARWMPDRVVDGQRRGAEYSVAVLRQHPDCDWWSHGLHYRTRLLLPGRTRPATVVLPLSDGRLVLQAPEALEPGTDVRDEVLAAWHAWRAGSA